MFQVRPLYPDPALLLTGRFNDQYKKFVVVADLHIGSETHNYVKGINFNSRVLVQNIINDLLRLIKSNKADGIVLLGDFKSTVSGITRLESENVPQVLASISKYAEIYLIPGNHDSFLNCVVPNHINLISVGGMVLGDILLIHGHTMPSVTRSSVGRIIMAHIHPIFLKPNNIVNGQRIWVYLKIQKQVVFSDSCGILEIIIMPSFFSSSKPPRFNMWKAMPPIIEHAFRNCAVEEMLLLTLDGSIVGDLSCFEG